MASSGTIFDASAMAVISAQDAGLKAAKERIAELEAENAELMELVAQLVGQIENGIP